MKTNEINNCVNNIRDNQCAIVTIVIHSLCICDYIFTRIRNLKLKTRFISLGLNLFLTICKRQINKTLSEIIHVFYLQTNKRNKNLILQTRKK